MVTQQDSIPAPTPTVCGNCGVEERRLLHHVRHRGIFRRLCTSCVLRFHPQSFCPTCFIVYDRSPPPSSGDTVNCFKCYSYSHSHCVGALVANPYVCPLCVNPSVPIFNANRVNGGEGEGGDEICREIDKKAAKVLLAAATIAVSSMSKAAATARGEAERRAKEAAFARKRAREALEHVAFLVAKEKLKHKELLPAEVSGSGNVVARERSQKAGNANSFGVANAAVISEQNRVRNHIGLYGIGGPNDVSARLNAVGLREERLQGSGGQNAVSKPQSNSAVMSVESNERLRVNPASNVGGPFIQNNESERSVKLEQIEKNNEQGEKSSNGLHSVPPVDELPHEQSNNGREDNISAQQ